MRKNSTLKLLSLFVLLAASGLAGLTGWAQVTLSTDGMLPVGTGAQPGFRWFGYQVGPLGNGLTTQNENSEGALIGLFGGTTVGTNTANLAGAGVQGYFAIPGVINFNGEAGDIGNFTGDKPVPGLPGVTSSRDNITAECLTYVEFPAAGSYTMGVNSDDGFRVTQGFERPRQAMIIDSPPAIAGPVGCSLPASLATGTGFGGPLPSTPLTAEVVLADPILADVPLLNAAAVAGKICIVDRGAVAFALKAKNAQDAGAIAVIVVNETQPTSMPIGMGGTDATVTIPSTMIGKPDGDRIKAALASGPVTMSLGALGGVELGTFNGGRGAADTTFTFTVPEAGLYPLRLLWYNGGGGLNVEWFSVDGVGGKHLLNNSADSASLRVFQGPIVTNWVAFNDHNPGANTAASVTPYNLWLGPGGYLTNFSSAYLLAGEELPPQVSVSTAGSPGEAGTMLAPNAGTPAAILFGDKITMNNACYLWDSDDDRTIMTFSGLDPNMVYRLRTTSVRGRDAEDAPDRWTWVAIQGADAATDFITTNGTVLPITVVTFPTATLTNGQIAWNSGRNQADGNIVGWDDISPGADGTFSVMSGWYRGLIPYGTGTATGPYGYGPDCFMLEEAGLLSPVQILDGPAGTNALQSLPFSLIARVGGTAPRFQWYKVGAGALPGATRSTYTVTSATPADAGDYFVVATSSINAVTSALAHVEVILDLDAPTMLSAFSYELNPFHAITLVWSEPVDLPTATDILNYSVADTNGVLLGIVAGGISLGSDQRTLTIQLEPGANMQPDTTYVVTVNDVTDWAGNAVVANSTVTFKTPPLSRGFLRFDYFNNIGTATVPPLLADPRYPNNPTTTYYLTRLNSREIFPDDTHETYGAHVTGFFIPPTNGTYIFYLASDDASQLYLNPTGDDAAGRVLLTEETGCCGNYAGHPSPPQTLVGGQRYWLEVNFKEGTGGDWLQVAFKDANDPKDPNTLTEIQSGFLAVVADAVTASNAPAITIVTHPVSQTNTVNGLTTFTVVATNATGATQSYQWRKNGVDIPAASGSSYTTPPAQLADDGAVYDVEVGVLGRNVRSATATLNVVEDTIQPTVVSASGDQSFTTIIIRFSELMDEVATEDNFSYAVSGPGFSPTVTSAVLQPDGLTVVLSMDAAMTPNDVYTIAMTAATDLEGNPVVSPAQVQAWRIDPGYLTFETYNTAGGNDVPILTGDPSFPYNPRETYYLRSFNSREVYPDDSHESYGGRFTGVFIPPTSGNWIFYMSSDDLGELWFNTAGPTATGKGLIISVSTCCQPNAAFPSSPQALTAGQQYYIEALYKEGGGGDYCRVVAKLDTDPTDPNALAPIPSSMLGTIRNPVTGSVTITQNPSDQTGVVSSPGKILLKQDFNAGNGSFTVTNSATPPAGPWVYNSAQGTWSANGGQLDPGGVNSLLHSPTLTVTEAGPVVLTFNHRYNFEVDATTRWDGGQVRLSVNGGPYTTVHATNFTANGYPTDRVIGGTGILNGQYAFNGESAGWSGGTMIQSVATLGTFNPGDQLSIQFAGAWDEYTTAAAPNWEIDSLVVNEAVFPLYSQDFTGTDGSFTVANVGTVAGPWVYNAGSGTWSANGGEGIVASLLNSPAITVVNNGFAKLTFSHRYNFEDGATLWDAGQVRLSVNGGTYATVPAENFSTNGYAPGAIAGNGILLGQRGFNGQSAGYSNNVFITSIATLTAVQAGDTLSVQFTGSWDDGYIMPPPPNWEIDKLSLDDGIALPVTFSVRATGTYPGATIVPIAYQWQKDTGTGFVDIPGASSSNLTFFVTEADNGSLYRCIVSIPGLSVTSDTALLTVGASAPTMAVVKAGGNAVISWPADATGYVLDQTATLVGSPIPWALVPQDTYQTNGSTISVTVPAGPDNQFFRLRKQ